MKKIFVFLLLIFFTYTLYLSTLDLSDTPPLKDGDLVFQSTRTDQSIAIALASGSWYIHTGIIKKTPGGLVVVEAGRTVGERPLQEWVDSGILKRFAVYRYRDLTEDQAQKVLAAAKAYYGKPYDHYFSFDNDAIYCSELEYLAFKDAGIPLSQPEKIGQIHINNPFTRKLIEQRWQKYPKCQGKDLTFDQCYDIIMSQELISPIGITRDSHLERIFSNYP